VMPDFDARFYLCAASIMLAEYIHFVYFCGKRNAGKEGKGAFSRVEKKGPSALRDIKELSPLPILSLVTVLARLVSLRMPCTY